MSIWQKARIKTKAAGYYSPTIRKVWEHRYKRQSTFGYHVKPMSQWGDMYFYVNHVHKLQARTLRYYYRYGTLPLGRYPKEGIERGEAWI